MYRQYNNELKSQRYRYGSASEVFVLVFISFLQTKPKVRHLMMEFVEMIL